MPIKGEAKRSPNEEIIEKLRECPDVDVRAGDFRWILHAMGQADSFVSKGNTAKLKKQCEAVLALARVAADTLKQVETYEAKNELKTPEDLFKPLLESKDEDSSSRRKALRELVASFPKHKQAFRNMVLDDKNFQSFVGYEKKAYDRVLLRFHSK